MQGEKKLLILGAGRSSSSLIHYLLFHAEKNNWKVKVADSSLELAQQKVQGHSRGEAVFLNVQDELQRKEAIKNADLVISLMPPPFHLMVAQTCIECGRHLLTASYVTPEIAALHSAASAKNILILMEMGLDPGIDHMSSLKEIEHIHLKGGRLTSFKSFTGGLVAPESDTNLWHYKITWNPRNVVLAGQGLSHYLENGTKKELSYKELFTHIEKISVKGYGEFEGYANRDSIKYLETYRLKDVSTFLRGTLRRPGFCSAWNILVQTGWTDDSYKIPDSHTITFKKLTETFLKDESNISIEEKLIRFGNPEDIEKIKWLGLLDDKKTGIQDASPAFILQKVLEEKLKLQPGDKDMIVMQHQLEYTINGKNKKIISSLVVKGEDEVFTAMAKTVGLPLGIAAKLMMENKIKLRGVQVPVSKDIYDPVLKELESTGIEFLNEEVDL